MFICACVFDSIKSEHSILKSAVKFHRNSLNLHNFIPVSHIKNFILNKKFIAKITNKFLYISQKFETRINTTINKQSTDIFSVDTFLAYQIKNIINKLGHISSRQRETSRDRSTLSITLSLKTMDLIIHES